MNPFNEITPDGWIDGLAFDQSEIINAMLISGNTEEDIARQWLSVVGPGSTTGFGTGSGLGDFYSNVKAEFVRFVCGCDGCEKERSEALKIWNGSGKMALVSFVAGFIATNLGLAAVALIPVVALLFNLVAKVGVNAFCSTCAN